MQINNHWVEIQVFPEHRVITATIRGCELDVWNLVNQNGFLLSPYDQKDQERMQAYKMPGEFKAVAKCHPDDTWDELIGIQVASTKLGRKYWKSFGCRGKLLAERVAKLEEQLLKHAARAKVQEDDAEAGVVQTPSDSAAPEDAEGETQPTDGTVMDTTHDDVEQEPVEPSVSEAEFE